MAMLGNEETKYPPPKRRLRLGIVGGGKGGLVGNWHATGARLSNRWDIIAGAMSSNPENAIASAAEWLIAPDRAYVDYREMATAEARRADGIEAVVICTPNWHHHEAAAAFMKAGIDVILDKPMTTSLGDALDLVRLRRENNVFLGMTYPYTFMPMARQARLMVQSAAIGEVRQVMVEYAQDWATAPEDPSFKGAAWRRDPAKVGRASAAGDIGTHAFHLTNYISGLPIVSVRADFHVCGAPKNMEDTIFMNLKLKNGSPGAMWITQAAPGNYCGLRIRLYGHKGGIEWNQENPEQLRVNYLNAPEQVIVRGHDSGMLPGAQRLVHLPRGHGEALSDAWGNMYTELALAVEQRRGARSLPNDFLDVTSAEDGARGVKFVEACAESHEAGGIWTPCWVDP